MVTQSLPEPLRGLQPHVTAVPAMIATCAFVALGAADGGYLGCAATSPRVLPASAI